MRSEVLCCPDSLCFVVELHTYLGGDEIMSLLATGKGFIQALEREGALGLHVPPEGGYEGRYLRRLRASGYDSLVLTARGLGDLAMYLNHFHGVRPPHLGKKTVNRDSAVGYVYYAAPILGDRLAQLPAHCKGIVLWILEGHVLSNQELSYLKTLPAEEPRLKVAIELGGDRYFRWEPLKTDRSAA